LLTLTDSLGIPLLASGLWQAAPKDKGDGEHHLRGPFSRHVTPQHQKEPLHNEEALARQLIATDKVDLKGMN
jgi:hypothetical protein